MREVLPLRWFATHLAVTLAVALVVGTLGPFGTFSQLGALDRYAYWLAIVPLNWLQILAFSSWLRSFALGAARSAQAVVAASCAIAALPATFEVLWLEAQFRPDVAMPGPLELYGYVLMLSLAIAVPLADRFLLPRAQEPVVPEPSSAPAAQDPAAQNQAADAAPFLTNLPERLGRELLCLEAEDHYLRVHTALGNDLVLCRLADAVARVGALEGRQVHRSYWVARRAVAGVERSGKKLALRLTNGLEVPVSRSFQRELRDAGWLG